MRATPNLDFTVVKPTESSLKSFVGMLRKVYLNLTNVINGNLGFGDGINSDNVSGTWINVVAPVAPNTDFIVNHNLNRLPVGYIVMEKDRACDVYTGSVAATQTQLTLRATIASAVLRLFVVALILSFLGFGAKAQTTNLTIQVTDTGGQSWNTGSWRATLITPPGVTPFGPPFFLVGTTTPVPNQVQSGLLSGSGSATMTLTQNIGILPSLSQWRFDVCSAATAVNNCFTQFATITATTTLTITPPALIVNATAITLAYTDSEVSSGRGGIYFNIITGLTRQCATATGTLCTLWQGFGGGGGGATLETNGTPNAVQNILNLISGANIGVSADLFGGVTFANIAPLQSSCGAQGTIQAAGIAGGCQTTSVTESGGVLSVNEDFQGRGPNPYVDIRAFGAVAVNQNTAPDTPGITASCTSGLSTVALSSASTFQNGNSVGIYGCGALTANTPAAPTIRPIVASGQTGTGMGVNAPAGSTTYCYQILSVTFMRGYAPSTEACTTTGPATLGLQPPISITSVSLANNVATYTTSTPHGLVPGALVVITGVSTTEFGGNNGQSTFNGWFTVAPNGVPDNNHFIVNLMTDTRDGAVATGTGGTANYWYGIEVKGVETTNNYQYYVYGSVSGASKPLIGVMLPQNHTLTTGPFPDPFYLLFDDFGSPVSTLPTAGFNIPTTVPASSSNDMLAAFISLGAGTTTLTLSASASNTISGQTILRDSAQPLALAIAQAKITGGYAKIPSSSTGTFVFNVPISVSGGNLPVISQDSSIFVNEPVEFKQQYLWKQGTPSINNAIGASFSQQISTAIFCWHASPCVHSTTNSYMDSLAFGMQSQNGTVAYVSDGGGIPASNFSNMTWSKFTGGPAYSQIMAVFRGGGATLDFKNNTVTGAQNSSFVAVTPGMFFDQPANLTLNNLKLSGVGLGLYPNLQGAGAYYAAREAYCQGCYMPALSIMNGVGPVAITIDNHINDTPSSGGSFLIANYGGSKLTLRTFFGSGITGIGGGSSGGSIGNEIVSQDFIGNPGFFTPGTTGRFLHGNTVAGHAGGFGTTGIIYAVDYLDRSIGMGQSYSLFTTTASPAAPTCTAQAGGSIAVGTYTLYYAPVYFWSGSEGVSSLGCSVTTSSGNQTINAVVPVTINGTNNVYTWYATNTANPNGLVAFCGVFTNTFTVSSGFANFPCNNLGNGGGPANPVGGPAGIQGGIVGENINILSQYMDIFETGPPANPPAGFERIFTNPTTHQLSCLLPSGASCSTTGSTPSGPNLSIQFDSSGSLGGIPVPTSPNGVAQTLSSAPSGGVGTAAAFRLPGVTPRVTVCPSNLDTVLATDRAGLVEWNDASACAVTLPQAGSGAGGNNDFTSNFVFLGCNIAAGTDTITPTTSTISYLSGGTFHGAQASMPLTTGQCAFTYSDNTNYFAFIISASGVTSFTGDSLVYSNSGSTGSVTLTLNTQLANKVLANCTGSTASPTFCSITLAMLPGAGATTVNGQSCALGGTCTLPPGTITIANAGVTGTTVNTLTKLTGAPSTAVITATTDTGGVVGITTSGAGTTGSAVIQLIGSVGCAFDGATISGDYVQISSTTVGNCHDTNSATYPLPGSGDVIGRVLSTNGAAGTYTIDLFPQEITIGGTTVTAASTLPTGTTAVGNGARGLVSMSNRLSCSAFSGADDSAKIQACLVALQGVNTQAGIADATGLSGLTWSLNPFAAASLPASGELWLPPGDTVTSVPTVLPDAWVIKGIGGRSVAGQYGSNLKASASWSPTYAVGTITKGTAGANDVITGSGTTWNTTNTPIGCAFVGGTQPNVTYGVISAIGSTTSITLKWGTDNGTGAAAASSYNVFCPVVVMGGGGASNAGAQFGIQLRNMGVDCNNIAGCVDVLNWYAQQHSEIHDTSFRGFTNIGLLVEGQPQNSGPYDNINLSPGSSCSASTIPLVIRAASQPLGQFHRITASKGSCATNPTVGIDLQGSFTELNTIDVEQVTTGISVGANTSCPVTCANPTKLPTQFHIVNAYNQSGSGTTVVAVSNFNGTPTDYSLTNIEGSVTNTFTDTQNACTETVSKLGSYIVDHAGAINQSTSTTSGCATVYPKNIASGTAVMGTSAIASGVCATVVTVAGTGIATTDTIIVGFNTDPTAITGYGASATGAVLTIYPYPTSGNANFKVCNSTASSITPGALTLNWKVVR